MRLSKLISQGKNLQMSRRGAEKLIREGQVTVAGKPIEDPAYQVDLSLNPPIKVNGRMLLLHLPTQTTPSATKTTKDYSESLSLQTKTRVWLVHKLKGEIVTDQDPDGRPSLMERLKIGGVGRPSRKAYRNGQTSSLHLKAIGRLDMMTEGLVIVTNDGMYARNMELPENRYHRTYRARVHGLVTPSKLTAIRHGITIDHVRYRGMLASLEMHRNGLKVKGGATNSWLTVTCCEGKNRQIRKVFQHLGLQVTRLIRISYGDYSLNTIPPGMAVEVPVKDLDSQKRRGLIVTRRPTPSNSESSTNKEDIVSQVQWIKQY
jgi:23S rRNA pseudouridine2605 synthase